MTSPSATRRPVLALLHLRTGRPDAPVFQSELDGLNAATARVAHSQGWHVVSVASAEVDPDATTDAVARADAVVLMGGEDVDPTFYDAPVAYPGSGRHEPLADRAHIDAVHQCLASGTPLLGICRGLQVLNVALGGTLVPHLPTTDRHRIEDADPFVRNLVTVTDPRLAEAVDATQEVRCSHHQAIDRVAEGLVVAARAEDGVVEAVIHESAPVTGVQWHPEHPVTAPTQLAALLRRLRAQCAVAVAS